jgi:hypothetical protein
MGDDMFAVDQRGMSRSRALDVGAGVLRRLVKGNRDGRESVVAEFFL